MISVVMEAIVQHYTSLSAEGPSPAVALTCEASLDLSLLRRAALPKVMPLSLGSLPPVSSHESPTTSPQLRTVLKGHPSLRAPPVVR